MSGPGLAPGAGRAPAATNRAPSLIPDSGRELQSPARREGNSLPAVRQWVSLVGPATLKPFQDGQGDQGGRDLVERLVTKLDRLAPHSDRLEPVGVFAGWSL